MRFTTTRVGVGAGTGERRTWSAREAVVAGMPMPQPSAGLFVPVERPARLGEGEVEEWRRLSTSEVAVRVARRFFAPEDVPEADLRRIVGEAYSGVELGWSSTATHGESVAELFHGPSLAFKDWGMRPAVALLDYFLKQENKVGNVVVCTSGDTGPSLLESARGMESLRTFVLFPSGRVSRTQAAQMRSFESSSSNVFEVEGADSDALDEVAARALADARLADTLISSMNSFNVARIVFSIPHYFASVFRAEREGLDLREGLTLVVPSGALGNAFAGMLAVAMGLPHVTRVVVATNENDAASIFFRTGELERPKAGSRTRATLSPAMDISVPYNVERCVWFLSGGDATTTTEFMRAYESEGRGRFPPSLFQTRFGVAFVGASASSAETLAVVRSEWEAARKLVDPHTAVGIACARRVLVGLVANDSRKRAVVVLGTAHPAKLGEELAAQGIATRTDWRASLPPRVAAALDHHDNDDARTRTASCVRVSLAEAEEALVRALMHSNL